MDPIDESGELSPSELSQRDDRAIAVHRLAEPGRDPFQLGQSNAWALGDEPRDHLAARS
jgi:hypothetical protein